MRRLLALRLLSVCLATIPVAAFALQATQKRVVVDEFVSDREAPPASLNHMWLKAGAVAALEILSTAPQPAAPDALMLRPRLGYDTTTYKAKVVEVLKGDAAHLSSVGGIVSVHRDHGDTDEGDYILRRIEKDFPAFVLGHEYVLFLNWNDYMGSFVVSYGPDAAYDITTVRIETPGQGPVARAFDGKPADELLTKLRALKKERGK